MQDVSPSELRLLAFTSIVELKEFKIKMQVANNPITTQKIAIENNRTIDVYAKPAKRKLQYENKRPVKITVIRTRSKGIDQDLEKIDIQVENNLLDKHDHFNAKSKRREELLKKRENRKNNREARENDKKIKEIMLKQTALEHAFEKAKKK